MRGNMSEVLMTCAHRSNSMTGFNDISILTRSKQTNKNDERLKPDLCTCSRDVRSAYIIYLQLDNNIQQAEFCALDTSLTSGRGRGREREGGKVGRAAVALGQLQGRGRDLRQSIGWSLSSEGC